MNQMEKQKIKQVYNLALFCFDSTSNVQNDITNFEKLPHNQVIKLLSDFLQSEFSTNFYNDFMNNLYQGEEVKLYFNQAEVEALEFQISELIRQKKNYEISEAIYQKEYKKLRINLLRAKKHDQNESYTLAPQNKLPGKIFLDMQENIEDSYTILHEGIHRMYLEANPKDYYLDELPSIWFEWKLYHYCIRNEKYKAETINYFRKNLEFIKNSALSFIMCNIIRNIYVSHNEISTRTILKNIMEIKSSNLRKHLKKEFQEIYCLDTSMIDIDIKMYANYLQAYYYGYYLSQNPNVEETLESIKKEVYHNENSLQRQIIKTMKNTEMVESFKKELKRIQEN